MNIRAAFCPSLLVLVLAAGCGLPTDDEALRLDPEDVPFGLIDPPPTTVQDPPPGTTSQVTLYYVDQAGEALVQLPTAVPGPGDAATVVSTLLGSDAEELAEEGALSAVPPETALLSSELGEDGVLSLDFSVELQSIQGPNLLLALGQLTCTATGLDNVVSVTYQIDGEDITVQNGEGVEQDGPVRCRDYQNLFV